MQGFKPHAGKAKNYANGGVVQQAPALAGKSGQGFMPSATPSSLGNGLAANAGNALASRKSRIDAASDYADGGEVKKGAAAGKSGGTAPAPVNPITDYASGGVTGRRMAELGLKDGGPVRGPGTGISDDIKTEVPEGSYIMPADSTEQIGEQQLAGMGKNVPVNLSNGEYQLPPEQVHAIGVQALDQMKDATHVPAAQQARGFTPGKQKAAGKPEHFFADGGEVEDPRKQSYAERQARYAERQARYEAGNTRANTPDPDLPSYDVQPSEPSAPSASSPNAARAGYKMAAGTLALPFAAGIDALRSGAVSLIDGDPNSLDGGTTRYTDAASDTISQGAKEFGEVGERLKSGARDLLGVKKMEAQAPTPTATPSAQSSAAQQPDAQVAAGQQSSPTAQSQQAASPQQPEAAAPAAPEVTATQRATALPAQGLANNVTREGNSFSGGTIRAGFTVNGQPAAQAFDRPASAQNQAAVQALLDRTPELGAGTAQPQAQAPAAGFQPGGGITFTGIRSAGQDPRMQEAFRAASTAYRGSPNGQLTANQINTMRGLIQDERGDATSRANNQANNEAALQREAMGQTGANYRTQMQEGGQNARFAVSSGLDERRVAGEEEARGFTNRAAARSERLYEQYEKAGPEDRPAIAQQIRDMSGKEAQNRFTVVPGGQEIDPTTQQLVTRPAMVFNNQTGQFVPQGRQALPPIAENPAVQQIMQNTSLSREERARQIRALGYQ